MINKEHNILVQWFSHPNPIVPYQEYFLVSIFLSKRKIVEILNII